MCVNRLYTLLARLLLNSRVLVKFWESQKLYLNSQLHKEVSTPNPNVVQGATSLHFHSDFLCFYTNTFSF